MCLKEISVPAESLPFIYKVLERIAKFYFTMPNVFQQLMNAIYHGKSQSYIAREKKISRQLANKRLMKEIGLLHLAFFLLQLEIAAVCYGISACIWRG